MNSNWEGELFVLLGRSPFLAVLVVAGTICLFRLKNRPHKYWLLGSAVALLLFSQLGLPRILSWLYPLLGGSPNFNSQNSLILLNLVFGLPYACMTAGAWGLLLYATFGEGSGPRTKYLDFEDIVER